LTTTPDVDDTPLPAADTLAEGYVLGAALTGPEGVKHLRQLTVDDFTPGAYQAVFRTIVNLDDRGIPVDPNTVLEELLRNKLDHGTFVLRLYSNAAGTDSAYWAERIALASESRRILALGKKLVQLSGAEATDERRQAINAALAAANTNNPGHTVRDRLVDGATFVLDVPNTVPAIWGTGGDVLWAQGEALMICGGNGVGKTTLATQIVRARIGLDTTVLGLPIEPGSRRILYLAMDRPSQIRRAMHRAFLPEERDVLEACLIFWKGPPLADMAQRPALLTELCTQADADTVIVDSLKDAAVGLSNDEVGAGWNRARQGALVNGIEVLELHHLVKRNANGGRPESIEDVYGSAWLTAGAGSVILLDGAPGDPLVKFRHLKQPMDELGPWDILHDHTAGQSTIHNGNDPLAILRAAGASGLTAKVLAEQTTSGTPRPADVQKARRRLDKLVADNLALKVPARGQHPDMYYARAPQHLDDEE
jgi:replicative DNA helicase